MANHPNRAKQAERAVLVTTTHRGVFFGYASDTDGATIKLRNGRNCIYWPQANKGFMGLANMGPDVIEYLWNAPQRYNRQLILNHYERAVYLCKQMLIAYEMSKPGEV